MDRYDALSAADAKNYALAAAKALLQNTDLSAREIAMKAIDIASDICVFTNKNFVVEEV